VQGLIKMHRLQKVRHAIIGIVVDEDRAQQRLLGLNVVRRLAVKRFGGGRWGDLSHGVIHGLVISL